LPQSEVTDRELVSDSDKAWIQSQRRLKFPCGFLKTLVLKILVASPDMSFDGVR
jgi:hypothetical protein